MNSNFICPCPLFDLFKACWKVLCIMNFVFFQQLNLIYFQFQASPNNSSFYPDADCNITELTVHNSGLDLDLYLNGNGKTSPAGVSERSSTTDQESDSGISDQSPKAESLVQERSRHESSEGVQSLQRSRHESFEVQERSRHESFEVQERSRHESFEIQSLQSNEDEAMLQVHRVEDGTLVIGSSPAR